MICKGEMNIASPELSGTPIEPSNAVIKRVSLLGKNPQRTARPPPSPSQARLKNAGVGAFVAAAIDRVAV
jgi:hypothetical protein